MIARISWKEEIDQEFRARYFELTGEEIEQYPSCDGGYFFVGSSRCTQEHADTLIEDFEELTINFEVL